MTIFVRHQSPPPLAEIARRRLLALSGLPSSPPGPAEAAPPEEPAMDEHASGRAAAAPASGTPGATVNEGGPAPGTGPDTGVRGTAPGSGGPAADADGPDDDGVEAGTGGRRARGGAAARPGPPGPSPGRPVASRLRDAVADHVPLPLRAARWDLPARALGALALILAGGIAWSLVHLWRSQPEPVAPARVPVVATGIRAGPAPPAALPSTGPPASPALIVVHVAGKVRHPGIVRLPAGSRVIDALAAAGGPAQGVDLTSLNLARLLTDGEQVLVGVAAGAGSGAGQQAVGTGPPPSGAGGLVDLNTATLEQLEQLPGVGSVLAQRILDWRAQHGRFTSIDQLREVSGIGERRFTDLKHRVRVS
ncbi:ComEA family DNA-binding protein [Carbonactinospora thermoautotrophica]|uniref:ComEA family DNA-binding protein n=1 Tax=Carbonactinospora thermoautotrophica TaxID=1469144 RepID=UPI00226F4E5B|nr:ComEA family DNA-binding protein [Carbonactinospora thermoautotrophica]